MSKLTPNFERRRYGNTTFTWIWFIDNNDKIFTPHLDPYQGKRPKDYIKQAEGIVREGAYDENGSIRRLS